MYQKLSFLCLFILVSCGENTPMKSLPLPIVQSQLERAYSPKLELLKMNTNDNKYWEFNTEQMFELEHLTSYLVQRSYFDKVINTRAPMKPAFYQPDTQGIILRLPMGVEYKLASSETTSFDLTISDFPYQDHTMFYVWYDVQEQKEVSGRFQLHLNSGGYLTNLKNISLDHKTLSQVAPANLRLILLSQEKLKSSIKINLDNGLEVAIQNDIRFFSTAVDLSKAKPALVNDLRKSFWICADCSDPTLPKVFVETRLDKIYQAANIGEITRQKSMGADLQYDDLRSGDEVEINLNVQVQRYQLEEKKGRFRYHQIDDRLSFKSRASTQCDYSFQAINYNTSTVNFLLDEYLEAITIVIDDIELSGLSYFYHYPHRFHRSQSGQLVMSYINHTEAQSIKVSFNPNKRAGRLTLKGKLLNNAGRSQCLEGLQTPRFSDVKKRIQGRNVNVQDIFTTEQSLRVYGIPRI